MVHLMFDGMSLQYLFFNSKIILGILTSLLLL